MAQERIGKLPPRYSFALNPHREMRCTRCPRCEQPTRRRKFAPEYVPLAGLLVLEWQETRVDLSTFPEGLALPATSLYSSQVASCAARRVVTVENVTSFNELLAVRPSNALALYAGGLASPAVMALLRCVYVATPQASFFHWGDLDAGGLRILAHLRG